MTEQEAIEALKDFNKQVTAKADGAYQTTIGQMACEVAVKALGENQQYRAIGTPEECRAAVEKQMAKNPVRITSTKKDGKVGKCPCCGSIIGEDMIWCDDCGQKLDWSDEE